MGNRAIALVRFVGPALRNMIAATLLLLAFSSRLAAHPLHTSVTILTYDGARGIVEVSIRVFADDLTRAAMRRSATLPADVRARESPLLGYIRSAFVVTDRSRRRLALAWCGGRREGDLMWLCFRSQSAPRGGLLIASLIFQEMYDDQINVVQVKSADHGANLLFTKGDAPKLIR